MQFEIFSSVGEEIVLIEEYLEGEEMSFIISDGNNYKDLELHKIIKEF